MIVLTQRKAQFLILEIASTYPNWKINRRSLLGNPNQPGDLERKIDRELTQNERAIANRAFEALLNADLIQRDWTDIVNPMDRAVVTELGKTALKNQVLDDLDEALEKIAPDLITLRDGAREALESNRTDSLRHAAQSGRELIRQVLEKLASPSEVKSQPGYKPAQTRSGITRKMQVKLAYKKIHGKSSDSEIELIESQCSIIDSLYDRLSTEAHRDAGESHRDVSDLLTTVEISLRRLLCAPKNN